LAVLASLWKEQVQQQQVERAFGRSSAQLAEACAALLVGGTGFPTEGAGAATAGWACILLVLRMAKSGELAFPARPSVASARLTKACAALLVLRRV